MNRREFLQLATMTAAGSLIPGCASQPSSDLARHRPKRGIALSATPGGPWRDKIQKAGARWFYTWNKLPPENIPSSVEFIPMIWNAKVGDSCVDFGTKLRADGYRELLGFNEPDQRKQADMTVAEALDLWPRLMETGLRLGSPSCVHPDKDWMKQFMQGVEVRNLRVYFVCVHAYGGPNPEALMNRLRAVHEMFARPLWITEFGVGDWQAKKRSDNKYKPEQVADFIKGIIPMLEACHFVERYAWFSSKPDNAALGPCALFNDDASLTPVGKAYRSA